MNEVSQKVINIIGNALGLEPDEVGEEMYLRDDLNIDHLTLSDIAVNLEEAFQIKIPQEDLGSFQTVRDIEMYVSEHLNEL